MIRQLKTAFLMLVILTALTGVLYPLVITVAAGVIFPNQANGSLQTVNGNVVGSSLIGQGNTDPRYFWSRPSAVNYMIPSSPDQPGSSGGSNAGPTSKKLQDDVKQREAAFRAANHVPDNVPIPPEMLFASGSGLDPHISPDAARLQVDRVAAARSIARDKVAALVEQYVEMPQFGLLGQPRVNVLMLNLALDRLQ
ncbi:MAG: potassium-transporting ATPase subunit KdpC [Anaerolineae bacterium]|nr:potassium-transporting ATPase subunit KdpC [Anaerolineae bacterium]